MPEGLVELATDAFLEGVAAADATKRVTQMVRQGLLDDWLEDPEHPRAIHVLAVGKAAPTMVWGLVEANVPFAGIGVSPYRRHRPTVDRFRWLDGDHPLPGDASLAAGAAVRDWIAGLPEDAPLLVLLSGGASAALERPAPGIDVEALRQAWRDMDAQGLDIVTVNGKRTQLSALKGGRLGRLALGRTERVQVWLVADTPPGTEAQAVGSGPFWIDETPTPIPHHVLASNQELVHHAGLLLAKQGWAVHHHPGRLAGPIEKEASAFHTALAALPKDQDIALIAGGEPTLPLPPDAPPGGRCQHAALAMSRFYGEAATPGVFLAAASDGVDGTTKEAGAWIDAATWGPEAEEALARCGAHAYLDARDQTLRTDATGTNVNELWLALRPREERVTAAPTGQGRIVTA